ncbi:MAG: ParA family protein [Ruminococcaceae bacterium]|nr:ParA family protein [Oscillospiraceae bacterium]
MEFKRLTLLSGHYGSGKTNIAVNLAFEIKKRYGKVTVADMDIVNPYFRTKDSQKEFEDAGIKLIASPFAGSNVDLPALPQEMYSLVDKNTGHCILDIGGDERGALVLGRYTPYILEENDYEMIFVYNACRPLTSNIESAIEVMREIEIAGKIPFTAIINNSNIGEETTPELVLNLYHKAEELAKATSLPLIATTVHSKIFPSLENKVANLIPLNLQKKIM